MEKVGFRRGRKPTFSMINEVLGHGSGGVRAGARKDRT
jgi:hypothetical protein